MCLRLLQQFLVSARSWASLTGDVQKHVTDCCWAFAGTPESALARPLKMWRPTTGSANYPIPASEEADAGWKASLHENAQPLTKKLPTDCLVGRRTESILGSSFRILPQATRCFPKIRSQQAFTFWTWKSRHFCGTWTGLDRRKKMATKTTRETTPCWGTVLTPEVYTRQPWPQPKVFWTSPTWSQTVQDSEKRSPGRSCCSASISLNPCAENSSTKFVKVLVCGIVQLKPYIHPTPNSAVPKEKGQKSLEGHKICKPLSLSLSWTSAKPDSSPFCFVFFLFHSGTSCTWDSL